MEVEKQHTVLTNRSGFPDDVLLASASGEVAAQDYREVLLQMVLGRLKVQKTLNFYYRLGADFTGFSAGAIKDVQAA